MGRIKTTFVKRKTKELFRLHPDFFTADYAGNKEKVGQSASFYSKKLRNIVAGYVTRLKKKEQ
ncbi:30S ribosomal protein S17e [Candidatus Woesearchaeota archaeon]|nr:30S ribosomal protein S17e [Candidatus Woesearchaeota archaeon]